MFRRWPVAGPLANAPDVDALVTGDLTYTLVLDGGSYRGKNLVLLSSCALVLRVCHGRGGEVVGFR